MKKKKTAVMLILLLLIVTTVSGCGQASSGEGTSQPEIDSGADSQNGSDGNSANDDISYHNIDMTGLPEPLDVRSADDGDLMVLVNKLYTVTADYYPTDMVAVDGSLSTNQGLYFKREAYDAYLKMLQAAKAEGIDFLICSTYRSYDTQKSLYDSSLANYGTDFTYTRTAFPGRSEHHTGWAVDITSASMGYGLSQDFADFPEGKWINDHCCEYGFIIRYPKGKTNITGYDYEPWHLRYVGTEAAKEITARSLTLEEYLGKA